MHGFFLVPFAPFLFVLGIIWLNNHRKLEEKRIAAHQSAPDDGRALLRDNRMDELEERLTADGLLVQGEKYRVQVAVKEIRVRSTFSAIMWGFMAGDDHIQGEVTILGAVDQPIHTFDVKASYALGGFAGGQDGMRMNWLYRRFAELTSEEIRNGNKKQAKS